jgi:hypothetical protein
MAQQERLRDVLSGPLDPDQIKQRTAQGWQLTALEWQRGEAASGAESKGYDNVPYGLRVAADCLSLEENPQEVAVLMLMMNLLISDKPFSSVANELNESGFKTRAGAEWSPVSVFNMLPRLIEMGPRIFSSEDWESHKRKMLRSLR